jgi:hypothetical protein
MGNLMTSGEGLIGVFDTGSKECTGNLPQAGGAAKNNLGSAAAVTQRSH